MDVTTIDEVAERQRLDLVADRGYRVPQGQGPATRRLRRAFHPVRTRLVPVVLGLAVAVLAPAFALTGNAGSIFLLVPSALLAWMTLHAVATSRR